MRRVSGIRYTQKVLSWTSPTYISNANNTDTLHIGISFLSNCQQHVLILVASGGLKRKKQLATAEGLDS